jgi:hypothetical protein
MTNTNFDPLTCPIEKLDQAIAANTGERRAFLTGVLHTRVFLREAKNSEKMTVQLSPKNMHRIDLYSADLKPDALSIAVKHSLINKCGMVSAKRLAGLMQLSGEPLSQIRQMIFDRSDRPALTN